MVFQPKPSAPKSLVHLVQVLNAGAVVGTQPGYYQQVLQVFEQVVLEAKSVSPAGTDEPCPIQVAPLYEQDNERSMFLHPFLVQQGCLPGRSKQAVLSVAFFNIGLTHHRKALSPTASFQQKHCYLSRAHATYLYSLELLDVPDLIDPDASLIYLYMALCLNLEQIEAALGATRGCAQGQGERQTWKQAMENAFWTISPNQDCPVYRHFERSVSSTEIPY